MTKSTIEQMLRVEGALVPREASSTPGIVCLVELIALVETEVDSIYTIF
jgi:hypothetical protein